MVWIAWRMNGIFICFLLLLLLLLHKFLFLFLCVGLWHLRSEHLCVWIDLSTHFEPKNSTRPCLNPQQLMQVTYHSSIMHTSLWALSSRKKKVFHENPWRYMHNCIYVFFNSVLFLIFCTLYIWHWPNHGPYHGLALWKRSGFHPMQGA